MCYDRTRIGEGPISGTEWKRRKVRELTGLMVHKHYCENDDEALIALFDHSFSWFGAGEEEYAVGRAKVTDIFRQFSGRIPKCSISDEEYHVTEISEDIYLCTGRMRIATDPSAQSYLRVHQRITSIFRWEGEEARCCHIHISNPYIEMTPGDVGFPQNMALQSYEYMQECIAQQKRQIEEQTAELRSIYNTIPCAIIRMRRNGSRYRLLTFNKAMADLMGQPEEKLKEMDWSRGFSEKVLQEDISKIQKALAELKKPGDSSMIDYRIQREPDDTLCVSCINSFISEDPNGQVIQRIAFDISRRMELESMLKRMSFEDTLTGLFNRNKFNQDVEALHFCPPAKMGVICWDINGLKRVNDRLGHIAGDALIHRTAQHIRRYFGKYAYRIGGDEFVAVDTVSCEQKFLEMAAAADESMREDHISISAGFSWRDNCCSIKEQLEEADKNMYIEKKKFYNSGDWGR